MGSSLLKMSGWFTAIIISCGNHGKLFDDLKQKHSDGVNAAAVCHKLIMKPNLARPVRT